MPSGFASVRRPVLGSWHIDTVFLESHSTPEAFTQQMAGYLSISMVLLALFFLMGIPPKCQKGNIRIYIKKDNGWCERYTQMCFQLMSADYDAIVSS